MCKCVNLLHSNRDGNALRSRQLRAFRVPFASICCCSLKHLLEPESIVPDAAANAMVHLAWLVHVVEQLW